MPDATLDDKARSVFTFAAYHSLVSGDPVREVVLQDGNGHRADPDGIEQLRSSGLIEVDGERGRFTQEGLAMLDRTIEAVRGVR